MSKEFCSKTPLILLDWFWFWYYPLIYSVSSISTSPKLSHWRNRFDHQLFKINACCSYELKKNIYYSPFANLLSFSSIYAHITVFCMPNVHECIVKWNLALQQISKRNKIQPNRIWNWSLLIETTRGKIGWTKWSNPSHFLDIKKNMKITIWFMSSR